MRHCTIVQMISTKQLWTLNFEYWIFVARNSSCLTSFPTGEDGRGFFKASFHRLHHLLSALSQAIPPCFERKTEPLPTPPSFCRRAKCRGENNLLEIPCCPVSWLTLSYWRGMGEAPLFFSEKVSAVRLGWEDDEMETLFSNFNILLTQPFRRNENLWRCFLGSSS